MTAPTKATRAYLAAIGRKGGTKSRRTLTHPDWAEDITLTTKEYVNAFNALQPAPKRLAPEPLPRGL